MSKIFPKWSNSVPLKVLIILTVLGVTLVGVVWYYFTPKYTRVGYAPTQPVAFDHRLHAGDLGIDCRYCHTHVERSKHSTVPPTSTCMNCHNQIKTESPALELVRASHESGESIPWIRVHEMPDYVFFDHSVHVNRGISCYECHGQVNEMEVVRHEHSFSMGWCLECHRQPENHLRPPEEIYNMDWQPESQQARVEMGVEFKHDWNVNPPLSCSACHR